MRSKDFAKASGLAVVFDLTAHTFYPLRHDSLLIGSADICQKSPKQKKRSPMMDCACDA